MQHFRVLPRAQTYVTTLTIIFALDQWCCSAHISRYKCPTGSRGRPCRRTPTIHDLHRPRNAPRQVRPESAGAQKRHSPAWPRGARPALPEAEAAEAGQGRRSTMNKATVRTPLPDPWAAAYLWPGVQSEGAIPACDCDQFLIRADLNVVHTLLREVEAGFLCVCLRAKAARTRNNRASAAPLEGSMALVLLTRGFPLLKLCIAITCSLCTQPG